MVTVFTVYGSDIYVLHYRIKVAVTTWIKRMMIQQAALLMDCIHAKVVVKIWNGFGCVVKFFDGEKLRVFKVLFQCV